MKQLYNLQKPEREEEILKRLIYYIQCDIEALGCGQSEEIVQNEK